jgi:transcriptional regulator with XRE-family HTH domain
VPGPPAPDEQILRVRRQVGDRIRALREAAGLTQQALAERCGLDNKTISRMENAVYAFSIDQCIRVARGIGCPLVWLFSDDRLPPTE